MWQSFFQREKNHTYVEIKFIHKKKQDWHMKEKINEYYIMQTLQMQLP